ncbi:MAG TPA: HIT family protein [Acidimicrobiales bacterium]|nr:HIT family protein [Acidimicrobiales bacterium]
MRRSWVRIPLQAPAPDREDPLSPDDCLVCAELDGRVAVPGGAIAETPLAVAIHLPPLPDRPDPYAGHLLVCPRRHAAGFADLSDDEARDVGALIARASRALRAEAATRVYTATIGHGVEHLHVHVIARWPETPDDVAWNAVDEWPGARRLDADGVAALAARLAGVARR